MATRSEKLGARLVKLAQEFEKGLEFLADENAPLESVTEGLTTVANGMQEFYDFWQQFGVQLPEYESEVTPIFDNWNVFLEHVNALGDAPKDMDVVAASAALQADFDKVLTCCDVLKKHVVTRIQREASVAKYDQED